MIGMNNMESSDLLECPTGIPAGFSEEGRKVIGEAVGIEGRCAMVVE